MHKSYALLALLAPIALIGCSGPSLVGKWNTEFPNTANKVQLVLDMKNDGHWSGRMSSPAMQVPGIALPAMDIDSEGTWKQTGDKLTFDTSSVQLMNAPDQLKSVLGGLEDAMKQSMNKYNNATVKFVDANTATFTTAEGQVLTLKKATP